MTMQFQGASEAEIEEAVDAVLSVMPAPRGMDGIKLVQGYLAALKGFPAWAIREGVDGFLSGRFSGEFSTKFCPTPPDLATMVRKCLSEPRQQPSSGRKHAFKPPSSRRVESGIRRDDARRLVDQGMYPRGSVWVPGDYAGDRAYGDLYAPDDNWAEAVPLSTAQDEDAVPRSENLRMTPEERRHCIDKLKAVFFEMPPRERAGFFGRDHSVLIDRWLSDLRRGIAA